VPGEAEGWRSACSSADNDVGSAIGSPRASSTESSYVFPRGVPDALAAKYDGSSGRSLVRNVALTCRSILLHNRLSTSGAFRPSPAEFICNGTLAFGVVAVDGLRLPRLEQL
jgi:hypothetical protein